jgi:hypothetical protein
MSIEQQHTAPVNMVPFVGYFLIALFALQVLVIVITSIFEFDAGSAMGIIVMFVSTQWPMSVFVNQYSRMPTKGERARFAIYCAFAGLVLSLALIYVLGLIFGQNVLSVLFAEARASGMSAPLVIGGILLIGFAVGWLVVYFASGFSAKQAIKIFEKKAGQ